MNRIVEYHIISLASTPNELELAVRRLMEGNTGWWEPLGPPFYSEGSMWCQAVVQRMET